MKKIVALFMAVLMFILCSSCGSQIEPAEPEIVQMRSICELATMDCYFHRVLRYYQEDAEKGWFGISKDMNFWVEYTAVVSVGVDASLVTMQVSETEVTITIPPAEVFDIAVDDLTQDSFIVDKKSADVKAEHEAAAFADAEKQLREAVESDATLLASAQSRAMSLMEDYIKNLGDLVGVEYSINWVYVDGSGNPIK